MNDPTLNPREVALLEALEVVQQRIATGIAVAAALEGAPAELRADVEATLAALRRVKALAEAPAEAFGADLEARFLKAVESAQAQQRAARAPRRWFGAAMVRTAAVLGAVVLALAGGGFAAVQAAESTIPGDTLYPVKEAGEAVRVFFARGDGVTRLRLAQLGRRQAELEAALQRRAPARVLLALEVGVAKSTAQLVAVSRRSEAAGNPAPAQAALAAITLLHDRIDVLAAAEARPEVARTLRRMSNYLAGQERELGGARGAGESPVPAATPPPSGARGVVPPAIARGVAAPALASPDVTATASG